MQVLHNMIGATFLLLLLLIVVSTGPSQGNLKDKASANLYEKAVSACVTKQLKNFGGQGEETRMQLLKRIFLLDDSLTTDLPAQFGEIIVSYLNSDELVARYQAFLKSKRKTQRNEIPYTLIHPMRNEGTTLIISLTDYWFSHKKHTVFHSLEGGCNVSFNFDSNINDFIISKTELWGV